MAGCGPAGILLCAQVQPLRIAREAPQESPAHRRTIPGPRRALQGFLGAILVQLPPNWKADPDRLAAFLQARPRNHRWVLEFRDQRWLCEEVFDILKAHRAALCVHDMVENHPRRVTAGWVYLRFHGDRYGGSYSPQYLTARAKEIQAYLADGLDVYAYFNNDAHGYAVRNAADLRRYVTGE